MGAAFFDGRCRLNTLTDQALSADARGFALAEHGQLSSARAEQQTEELAEALAQLSGRFLGRPLQAAELISVAMLVYIMVILSSIYGLAILALQYFIGTRLRALDVPYRSRCSERFL